MGWGFVGWRLEKLFILIWKPFGAKIKRVSSMRKSVARGGHSRNNRKFRKLSSGPLAGW